MDKIFVPSTWRRLMAHGIDQGLQLVLYIPFGKSFFLLIFTDESVRISLVELFVLFMIPALYEWVFLTLMQATPGKWMMGLKVVPFSSPLEALSWQHCFLRPLVGRLSFFFSWGIFALAFFRYDRTHLADWMAETRVVQFVPRIRRASVRPILGALLCVFYVYEGLSAARSVLQIIDWENRQADLRALTDFESLSEVMEDYE